MKQDSLLNKGTSHFIKKSKLKYTVDAMKNKINIVNDY